MTISLPYRILTLGKEYSLYNCLYKNVDKSLTREDVRG